MGEYSGLRLPKITCFRPKLGKHFFQFLFCKNSIFQIISAINFLHFCDDAFVNQNNLHLA